MSARLLKHGAPSPVLVTAIREAALTGLLVVVLAVPFLGLKIENAGNGLLLETRWPAAFIAVGLAMGGRVLLVLGREWWHRPAVFDRFPGTVFLSERPLWGLGMAGILLALFLPLLLPNRYAIDTATTLLIYVMLGWGLNIVVGLAGLLDLGYVAFYAVGAYSYALLSLYFDYSFWLCLPLAGLLAALFGILLGFPVLRLRGDYLAIVTLGFGEIIRVVLTNWNTLTHGSQGISGIPRPSFFGLPFGVAVEGGPVTFSAFFGIAHDPLHRVIFLYYLILVLALGTNAFTLRIRRLPIGRAWEALREDETACRALGLDPTTIKLSAFAIGAMFAGLAGSFFAARQGFVSPESFAFLESAIILAIVVLGGMGSQTGVVVAAFVLVVLPEWFRDFVEYRMFLFGAAMVAVMLWRPQGLLSHRAPTLRLSPGPAPPH
ncbi:MAG: branched-chain amino acid transport system permease protein [Rhodospirillaceae bacterium]|nr:MAG: branched-chain amino acid transport system permease protein [Rhodospirillaceae bacterium]